MRQNTFPKKKPVEMLIEQILEFELKGPGPYFYNWVFLSRNKNL